MKHVLSSQRKEESRLQLGDSQKVRRDETICLFRVLFETFHQRHQTAEEPDLETSCEKFSPASGRKSLMAVRDQRFALSKFFITNANAKHSRAHSLKNQTEVGISILVKLFLLQAKTGEHTHPPAGSQVGAVRTLGQASATSSAEMDRIIL